MNKANVAALDELFREAWRDAIRVQEKVNVRVHDEVARLVAERLAARGVLVPAALTDEEIGAAWEAGAMDDYDNEGNGAGQHFAFPERTRAALVGIATGERVPA